ncbi:MAG TPA: ATP-binding protein [Terriglobales bacterium]|nr:ATP-binding protein [Terriglobales bacterium]
MSETQNTLDALRAAEQRLQATLNNAPLIVFALDCNGVFTLSEGRALQKLALRPGEVVGRSITEQYGNYPELLEQARRALKGEEFTAITELHDLQVVFETRWVTARDEAGKQVGVIGISTDITAHRQDELARRNAEIRYQAMIEQIAAVTYIAELGINGKWLYVSPQIETMLGFPPRQWLADSGNWIRFIHPDDRAEVIAAENATIAGKPFRAEYRMYRADGKTIWISDTGTLVPDDTGKYLLLHGVLLDVTERKEMEIRLLHAQRLEAIGQLASGVAHDFNNLVTIIKGYCSLLEERVKEDTANARAVREIHQAADRAASLTHQLLAFSRKQILQPRILDLNTVVRDAQRMLRRLIGENVEIEVVTAPKLGMVKADPVQIEQVIVNLALNARDAMPNGGKLRLQTSEEDVIPTNRGEDLPVRPGRYVQLAVSDSGRGMDPETQKHVFEPFFTTKATGRGTGLGLATLYGIIKQSDGYVGVDSQPGHGTTFRIYLPVVDQPANAPAAPQTYDGAEIPRETILVAEDESQLRELARTVLSRCGYEVLVGSDANEVDFICANHTGKIDLFLTDVVMPGLSGPELAKRVMQRYPSIKVLFMSGYADAALIPQGVFDGELSFLQKPFTPSVLKERVRAVLDQEIETKPRAVSGLS